MLEPPTHDNTIVYGPDHSEIVNRMVPIPEPERDHMRRLGHFKDFADEMAKPIGDRSMAVLWRAMDAALRQLRFVDR